MEVVKIAQCDRCLQFPEDCECCTDCGCVEVHDYGCSAAETRPRVVVRNYQTLRGLGAERRVVVHVADVGYEEHTERFLAA